MSDWNRKPTLGKLKTLKRTYTWFILTCFLQYFWFLIFDFLFFISYFLFFISYFLFLRGFLSPSVSLIYKKGFCEKKSALFRVKTISLFGLKIECMFMPRKETPHTPQWKKDPSQPSVKMITRKFQKRSVCLWRRAGRTTNTTLSEFFKVKDYL